jgi:hypothetical protein
MNFTYHGVDVSHQSRDCEGIIDRDKRLRTLSLIPSISPSLINGNQFLLQLEILPHERVINTKCGSSLRRIQQLPILTDNPLRSLFTQHRIRDRIKHTLATKLYRRPILLSRIGSKSITCPNEDDTPVMLPPILREFF